MHGQQMKCWEWEQWPLGSVGQVQNTTLRRTLATAFPEDRPVGATSRTKEHGCHQEGAVTKGGWAEAGNKKLGEVTQLESWLSGFLCTSAWPRDGCPGPACSGLPEHRPETGGLGEAAVKLTSPSLPRILFHCSGLGRASANRHDPPLPPSLSPTGDAGVLLLLVTSWPSWLPHLQSQAFLIRLEQARKPAVLKSTSRVQAMGVFYRRSQDELETEHGA